MATRTVTTNTDCDKSDVSILFCKHSDVQNLTGDITSHICCAVNAVTPNKGLGAQKIRGLWVIGVKLREAQETLLQRNISINSSVITLYRNNPYDLRSQRVEGSIQGSTIVGIVFTH